MTIFKKLGWLVLVVALAGGALYVFHRTPCERPVAYSVGTFDTRFGISRADFIEVAGRAESVWEKAIGKNLFEYKASDGLPVSLIFDDRQKLVNDTRVLETKVNVTQAQAEVLREQFIALRDEYEAKKQEYESLVAAYESEGKDYSREVDYLNSRGGASPAEYDRLNAEKERLARERADIETKRVALNDLAPRVNAAVGNYNNLVRDANSNIETINRSADKDFEQGEYISDNLGQRINIYEYESKAELTRVLAHEFAHAIGLEHNPNPKSVMYYINKSTDLTLSPEDIASMKELCGMK